MRQVTHLVDFLGIVVQVWELSEKLLIALEVDNVHLVEPDKRGEETYICLS